MLRLNRLTDYGVVVMVQLARSGEVMTAQRLAERTSLPAPTVAKLLALLAKSGLAAAQRGAAGGYALARAPRYISVADIIETLEGPVALTACVDGANHLCSLENVCAMRGHWDTVNNAIRRALESLSLEEIAREDEAFLLGALGEARRSTKTASGETAT
jgi:FeS assembly SUF system regulator